MSVQQEAAAAMDFVFDFFSRDEPVTFYRTGAAEIVATSPSWNSDFGNPYSDDVLKRYESREVTCRVTFVKDESLTSSLNGEDNLNLKLSYPTAKIKLKVKSVDFNWLKDSDSFYFKGEKFIKDGDWRGIGMLGAITVYEITLKKNQ